MHNRRSIRLQAPARNLYASAFSLDGRLEFNGMNLLQSQRSKIVFNYSWEKITKKTTRNR